VFILYPCPGRQAFPAAGITDASGTVTVTVAAAAASLPPALPAPATCRDDIAAGMFKRDPPSRQGLVASYSFLPENVKKSADGKVGGWLTALQRQRCCWLHGV
jgi:hypothetical protein